MSSTSHLAELDLLRKQVADLARELTERDQTLQERKRQLDDELQDLRERSEMLRAIVTGTAAETGEEFFPTLVSQLSSVLGVQYAVVGEVHHSPVKKIRTVAVAASGRIVDNFEYPLTNTPCETALHQSFACYERDLRTLFPLFGRLGQLGVEGYCGVALRAKGGAVIGLLIVMDTKPLRNTERLKSLMAVFASRAGAELQRRQVETKLTLQQRHLIEAQSLAHLGSWDWDLDSGNVQWSDEQFRIFGYEPGSMAVTYETFVTSLHQQDRDRVQKVIDDALRDGAIYDVECRMVRPDGEIRAIHCRGEVLRDANRRPLSVSSSVLDITDRKQVEEELRTSQEQLRQALRASGTGLWNWNTETNEAVISEEWKRQVGYRATELLDSFETWTKLLHPDDQERAIAYVRRYVNAPKGDYRQEFRLRHKNGTYRWIEARASFVVEPDGRRIRLLGSHTDITEHKRMEEALLRALQDLRNITETVPDILYTLDLEGRVVDWNQHVSHISGLSPTELLNRSALVFVPEEERSKLATAIRQVFETGTAEVECHLLTKDGRTIPYHWTGAVLKDRDGQVIGITGSGRDITALKQAERAVRENEERYRTLVELSPSGVFVFCEGRTVYINRTGALLLGAQDPQEILDRPTFDVIHPDYHQEVRDNVTRLLGGGVSVHSAERVYVRMDGTTIPVQVEAGRITWDGKPAILGMFTDITERKHAEEVLANLNATLERQVEERTEALRRSEARFRQFFDNAPNVTCLKDHEGRYVYTNRRFDEVFGLSSGTAVGKRDEELFSSEQADLFRSHDRAVLTSRRGLEFEEVIQQKDGPHTNLAVRFPVTGTAGPSPVLGMIATDITERRRTQEQLKLYQEVFTHSIDGIAIIDTQGRYLEQNRAHEQILGYSTEDLTGNTPAIHLGEESFARIGGILATVGSYRGEIKSRTKGGTEVTLDLTAFAVKDAEGQPVCYVGIKRDVTERNRAQEALRESEARWQQFAESVGSAFWIADVTPDERKVLYVNSAFTFIWGIEREEIYRNWSLWPDSIHPDDRTRVKVSHDRFVLGGTAAVFHCEYRIVGRDGHIRWISDRRVRMAGWEHRIAGIAEDITHHKQQLALMAQTESIGKIGGWQLDFLTDRLWWSEETYRLHETSSELYSPTVETALNFYTPGSRPIMAEALEKGVRQGEPWDLELELLTAKGRRIAVRAVGKVDVVNGRAVRAYGTFQDITERKVAEEALRRAHDELERKVMDRTAELRESEERYARATAIGKVGVWEWDIENDQYYYGAAHLMSLFGYVPDELSPDPDAWLNLVHPDDQSIALSHWEEMRDGRANMRHLELRMVKKDSSIVWIDVRCHSVRDQHERLIRLIGAAVDITERKQAEEALRESEERFSKAFRTSLHPIGITEVATGRCIEVNDACLELFGFRREEVIGNTTLMLGIWPNLEDRVRLITRLKAGEPVRNMEFGLRTKSGQLRYFLASCDLAELNGTLCLITVGSDITERKRAEEALRISEERFAKAFQASPHPVVISELDSGRVVDANDAACQLFGYYKPEVVGRTTLEIGLWHSMEERSRYLELLKSHGSVRNVEVKLRSRNGEIRQCLLSSELIELNGKQCSVTVGDDVTESKRMERALRLTQFSVDQAVEAVLWVNPTGRIFNVNDTACRMLGYSRQDLTGMTVHDIDPNFPAERWAEHWNHLKEQGALAFEAKYWSRIGDIVETEVTFNYLQYDGKEYGCAILRDIGERKRAEATLKRSEERLRSIFENAGTGIAFADAEGRYIQCNPAYCAIVGYSKAELSRTTDQQLIHPDDYVQNRELVRQLASSSIPSFEIENRYIHKNGHIVLVHKFVTALRGDDGRLTHFIALVTDISERKRAEAELRQSHRFLRQVIDTAPNLIFAKDQTGRFTMANKAVADCYGVSVEELIGKSDADFNTNAEEVKFFRALDQEVMQFAEDRFIPEERITDAAGKTRWLQTVKRPIFDEQGQVRMVLGAATDITERKRMEEILLQSERDLNAALQERERISQDLHDGILQSLYAVGLGLEACKPMVRQQPDGVSVKFMATLDQAIGQLNHVMGEVRNFIAGLESHVIQGGEFPTALRNMVRTMSSSASATCTVRIDRAAARQLSTEQALHIINIVREGLSNALRHSGANRITVSLRSLIGSVRLAIIDNGIGFNATSAHGVGHGLSNMAARAQKVRGVFAIQSKPDHGTKILLDLPKDMTYVHN